MSTSESEPARLLTAEVSLPWREVVERVQVLVTLWPDGTAEAALRADAHDTWGPPVPMDEAP